MGGRGLGPTSLHSACVARQQLAPPACSRSSLQGETFLSRTKAFQLVTKGRRPISYRCIVHFLPAPGCWGEAVRGVFRVVS